MKCSLTYLNNFIYAVEIGIPFHLRPIKTEGGAWIYSDKIIATNDPTFMLPALSEAEKGADIEKLLEEFHSHKDDDGDMVFYRNGVIEICKAVLAEQFTDEDLKKAISFGYQKGMKVEADAHRDNKLFEKKDFDVDNYIKSLKRKPTAVELETYNGNTEELILQWRNGKAYVRVKEWYYE